MTVHFNLLEEPLIRTRLAENGQPQSFTLPGLFHALGHDAVRDFPAVRPHQRHPWHAFLVQLAAIALHKAGRVAPYESENEWKQALLDLTPGDPDGAAWCLVTPHDRPAFMQAPVPSGRADDWSTVLAVDEMDMLITSKNHDLKASRMRHARIDDWIMALVSLQTQEGYGGKNNWGISRMAGGFGCRVAVGADPFGHIGVRWKRDVFALLDARASILKIYGLAEKGGHELLWVHPWDGAHSLAFSALGPFYIEICRQIRLDMHAMNIVFAKISSSKNRRIAEHAPSGATGDAWTPLNSITGEALRVRANGFDYQLASALLFGTQYRKASFRQPIALNLSESDGKSGIYAVMQAVSRGGPKGNKSVTEGYHERRIPLSPKVRQLLMQKQTDELAQASAYRIDAIAKMRGILWAAMGTLFANGVSSSDFSDSVKNKATDFGWPFEQAEDARFFSSLNDEVESDDPESVRMNWLLSMANNAEKVLIEAFHAGPQSGEQRYRARAAALSWFHAGLRSPNTIPDLANYLKQRSTEKELANEHE